MRDLNPQALQYQCSSQPTELRSQVGVGHMLVPNNLYSNNDNRNLQVRKMVKEIYY